MYHSHDCHPHEHTRSLHTHRERTPLPVGVTTGGTVVLDLAHNKNFRVSVDSSVNTFTLSLSRGRDGRMGHIVVDANHDVSVAWAATGLTAIAPVPTQQSSPTCYRYYVTSTHAFIQ